MQNSGHFLVTATEITHLLNVNVDILLIRLEQLLEHLGHILSLSFSYLLYLDF